MAWSLQRLRAVAFETSVPMYALHWDGLLTGILCSMQGARASWRLDALQQ
jgi:hypothetical protein